MTGEQVVTRARLFPLRSLPFAGHMTLDKLYLSAPPPPPTSGCNFRPLAPQAASAWGGGEGVSSGWIRGGEPVCRLPTAAFPQLGSQQVHLPSFPLSIASPSTQHLSPAPPPQQISGCPIGTPSHPQGSGGMLLDTKAPVPQKPYWRVRCKKGSLSGGGQGGEGGCLELPCHLTFSPLGSFPKPGECRQHCRWCFSTGDSVRSLSRRKGLTSPPRLCGEGGKGGVQIPFARPLGLC